MNLYGKWVSLLGFEITFKMLPNTTSCVKNQSFNFCVGVVVGESYAFPFRIVWKPNFNNSFFGNVNTIIENLFPNDIFFHLNWENNNYYESVLENTWKIGLRLSKWLKYRNDQVKKVTHLAKVHFMLSVFNFRILKFSQSVPKFCFLLISSMFLTQYSSNFW